MTDTTNYQLSGEEPSIFASSYNSEKLSASVKGGIGASVTVLVSLFRAIGLEGIGESEVIEVIDSIALVVQSASALYAAAMFSFGAIRRFLVKAGIVKPVS